MAHHDPVLDQVLTRKQRLIAVAAGREEADLVLKHTVYLNVFTNELCRGDIALAEGCIAGIGPYQGRESLDLDGGIVLPGFLDAHIHLESTLTSPRQFARAVLPHGTTTVVADPHEIANVMGADGISYLLHASQGLPVDMRFTLPSCVPATPQDEAGAALGWEDIAPFYNHPQVSGLAEMMNYPGIVAGQRDPLAKVADALARHRRVDGHAPLLGGQALNAYTAAGISSDHECASLPEALEKLRLGQFILIRDGTAAKNLEALVPLLTPPYCERCLFCTDDKHPGDLLEKGHMDYILRRAIALGADPLLAVKAATYNAARYHQLHDRGAIAPGLRADLVVVEDLTQMTVSMVFQQGRLWYDHQGLRPLPQPAVPPDLIRRAHNTIHLQRPLRAADFPNPPGGGVIGLQEGVLATTDQGRAEGPDLDRDIIKLAVVERHKATGHIGLGYLQGLGLREGAIAASVAHDSHNLIVAGVDAADMAAAANQAAALGGGMVTVRKGKVLAQVPLPVAGLFSDAPVEEVHRDLEAAKQAAFALGARRTMDPFMALSFLALPVIPALRLTTRGVLDVTTQTYR